jgi:transposase
MILRSSTPALITIKIKVMESNLFMGCDISQEKFNYCLRNSSGILLEGCVENGAKPIKTWLNQLLKLHGLNTKQILFCMEHTGVYASILLRELSARSLTIWLESAMNIKLSLGMQRGKNDQVDARRIAEYAMRFKDKLRPWQPRRAVLIKLQLLNRMRARLVKAKADLSKFNETAKRFLTKEESQLIIRGTKKSIDTLTGEIQRADRQIEKLIQNDDHLKHLAALATSVDGIGMVTCSALLVKTNEFKDFTEAKKFACTTGIVPFEHSSGTSIRGKSRVNHNADKEMKKLIHMCAVSVIRLDGVLRDYYLRKISEGKPKMLVLNAVRNKLISRVFAVVRDNTMYEKNFQYSLVMS